MAEYRPFGIQFASKGLNVRGAPDVIELDEYVRLQNMTTDNEGALRTRAGQTLLATFGGAGAALDVHTLARLHGAASLPDVLQLGVLLGSIGGSESPVGTITSAAFPSLSYRYAIVGLAIQRAEDSEAHPGVFSAYAPLPFVGPAWRPGHKYEVGDTIHGTVGFGFFRVIGFTVANATSGVSGTTQPVFPGSGQFVDNEVIWGVYALSGRPLMSVNYALGIDRRPYAIFADPNIMFKDSGIPVANFGITGRQSASIFGIVPPATAPTPVVSVVQKRVIENFESATPNAYWDVSLSSVGTLATDSLTQSVFIPPGAVAATHSLSVPIIAAGTTILSHSVTLDLNTFDPISTFTIHVNGPGGGQVSSLTGPPTADDDFMQISVTSNAPQNITEMLLQLSLGDTLFREYYEKSITPSVYQPGVNFTSDTHGATENPVFIQLNEDRGLLDDKGDAAQVIQYQPAQLEPGTGIWSEVSVPRKEYMPIVHTNSTVDWGDVMAIRLQIKTTGAVIVLFDSWQLSGGGNLTADDYQWAYVYRNSETGQVSNPSPVTTALTAGPHRASVTLTGIGSSDDQVDQIDVYRIGGEAAAYRYSGTIENFTNVTQLTPGWTYLDTVADADLGAAIETDNDRPPDFGGIELHGETLFGWGAVGDPANMLRFSKRVNLESFPQANYIFVGTGSDKIVRAMSNGQALVVFTLSEVYQLYGTGAESYQASSTGYGRGMVDNPFAVCFAPGGAYHVSYDGIYQYPSGKKITQSIDGVFHGQSFNKFPAINDSFALTALGQGMAAVRLQFYDNKLHFLYPAVPSTVNSQELVFDALYDRWYPSTRVGRALLHEKDSSVLLMGTTDGHIYQLDRTSTTDNGTRIEIDLGTKFIDLGVPDQDKIWGDMALDIDTAGQNVDLQLQFNNGTIIDPMQSINTSRRQMVQVPINGGNGLLALNCQIAMTCSTALPVVIYKATFRVLVEPPARRNYVTDWTDDGNPGRKVYQTLVLDMDTMGTSGVHVEMQMDGATAITQGFYGITTVGRQVKYFAIRPQTMGTLRRLKFTQIDQTLTSSFKLYPGGSGGAGTMEFLQQPLAPSDYQSEWTDNGYPYDKYWKEVLLDINTFGQDVIVQLQVDEVTRFSFTVNTALRQRITKSMPADIIGKLGRTLIGGGAVPSPGVLVYSATFVTVNEPPDVTRADSLEQTFGIEGWKVVKRVWLALKNPAAVTVKVYADEILRATLTIPVSALTTGWVKNVNPLPSGVKGKYMRFILTSALPFKVYWNVSQVETKPVRGQIGYGAYKFQPPEMT